MDLEGLLDQVNRLRPRGLEDLEGPRDLPARQRRENPVDPGILAHLAALRDLSLHVCNGTCCTSDTHHNRDILCRIYRFSFERSCRLGV